MNDSVMGRARRGNSAARTWRIDMTETYFRSLLLTVVFLAPALGGADGGCSPGQIPIGGDPSRGGSSANPVTCGDVTCAEGQVCCNPSCGICTAPGGACTAQLCEQSPCSESEGAIRSLIAAAQSCESDADCTVVNVSCLPNTSCTGNIYVNRGLDQNALAGLVSDLNECVNGDPKIGCPACLRLDPPPACIDNVCQAKVPPLPAPCAGKECGETCSNCLPGQPCPAILEVCDAKGECGGLARCPTAESPCAGKQCGDTCSNCLPGQPCPLILEYCDASGTCGGTDVCR
jgi:hypothetical protein